MTRGMAKDKKDQPIYRIKRIKDGNKFFICHDWLVIKSLCVISTKALLQNARFYAPFVKIVYQSEYFFVNQCIETVWCVSILSILLHWRATDDIFKSERLCW